MNRTSTLLPLLTAGLSICLLSSPAFAQETYVDNGGNTTYTLNSGDSLYFSNGTFTGIINTTDVNTKITVGQNAIFKPTAFAFPGKFMIYGNATLTELNDAAGCNIINYGRLTIEGVTEMNANNQSFVNSTSGIVLLKGSLVVGSEGGVMENKGNITIEGGFKLTGNSTISNKNNFTIEGALKTSGGTIFNEGKFYDRWQYPCNQCMPYDR